MNNKFEHRLATAKIFGPLHIVKSVKLRADLPYPAQIHYIVPSLWVSNQRGVNTKYLKKGELDRQRYLENKKNKKEICVSLFQTTKGQYFHKTLLCFGDIS